MGKLIGNTIKQVMGGGEKKAPVKSIKLKIKFQKPEEKKKEMARKIKHSGPKFPGI